MANYVKATNFTAKDSLPVGNAGKIVKGTEIDVELTAVAAAIASKADSNSPTLTGTPLAPTANSGTNNTQIATTAFVTTAVASVIPSGLISLWSGSVASIPSGWYLCNGSNGTPDLRNRFVVGAGSTYAVDATGGSADAVTVSHTHTFSATTSTAGDHTHTVTVSSNGSDDPAGSLNSPTYHTATGAGGALGTPTWPTLANAGSHNHTISGTTASTGSSGTNANLPPYYALCYIMKA
jgi:hypothetical protein